MFKRSPSMPTTCSMRTILRPLHFRKSCYPRLTTIFAEKEVLCGGTTVQGCCTLYAILLSSAVSDAWDGTTLPFPGPLPYHTNTRTLPYQMESHLLFSIWMQFFGPSETSRRISLKISRRSPWISTNLGTQLLIIARGNHVKICTVSVTFEFQVGRG